MSVDEVGMIIRSSVPQTDQTPDVERLWERGRRRRRRRKTAVGMGASVLIATVGLAAVVGVGSDETVIADKAHDAAGDPAVTAPVGGSAERLEPITGPRAEALCGHLLTGDRSPGEVGRNRLDEGAALLGAAQSADSHVACAFVSGQLPSLRVDVFLDGKHRLSGQHDECSTPTVGQMVTSMWDKTDGVAVLFGEAPPGTDFVTLPSGAQSGLLGQADAAVSYFLVVGEPAEPSGRVIASPAPEELTGTLPEACVPR